MFEEYDADTLLDNMLEQVDDNIDKREGSIIYDALAPTALLQEESYAALDMVMNEVFADTASYYFLIKRAAERGLYPKEESYMTGKLVIEPASVVLSAGERFNMDEYNYAVVEAIDAEAGSYKVQCETAGSAPNQQLGTLLPIEYVEGLESAELTEILIPGEDEEDVEDFRQRYFDSFTDEAFGGNKAAYAEKVKSIEGVGACKIVRVWEGGYDPSQFIPSIAVSAWMTKQSVDTVGTEVYAWLKAVYEAAGEKLLTVGGTIKIILLSSDYGVPSSALVDAVQTAIDPEKNAGEGNGIAPIGHVVNVIGAKAQKIDIKSKIEYESGATFETVKTEMETAIDGYLDNLTHSWDEQNVTVRISQIESLLLNIEGIVEIADTTINGAAANYVLGDEYIPVRGDIDG